MKLETRRNMRFNEKEWEALRQQAEKLGTDRTGYIKLMVKIDAASEIIKLILNAKIKNH